MSDDTQVMGRRCGEAAFLVLVLGFGALPFACRAQMADKPRPAATQYGYRLALEPIPYSSPGQLGAVRVSARQSLAVFHGDMYRQIRVPAALYRCELHGAEVVCVRRRG